MSRTNKRVLLTPVERQRNRSSRPLTFEDRKNDSRKGAKIAKMDENSIGKEIVDAAIAVHRELGPRLLETVYKIVVEQKDPWRSWRLGEMKLNSNKSLQRTEYRR